jgi:hypothetical protein
MLMLIMATHVGVVYLARGIVVCPRSHSRLYLGFLFLVEELVPVFWLALTTSDDVVSSMEASLSEPLGGCCYSGQGGFWFRRQL